MGEVNSHRWDTDEHRLGKFCRKNGARSESAWQKHSIFVCRASGAFNSFLTKIACSEVPSDFVTHSPTGSHVYFERKSLLRLCANINCAA